MMNSNDYGVLQEQRDLHDVRQHYKRHAEHQDLHGAATQAINTACSVEKIALFALVLKRKV